MAKTRRARIDAENNHRRVTRLRSRIIVKETRGYPTDRLRASSDTIQHGPESREVGCGFSIILDGLWLLYDEVMSISANSCASCRRVARVRRARVVVRACANTRARTNKGAGGSEGARARVDRTAQVAISGGRTHSGPAEVGLQRCNQAMFHAV